MTAELNALGSLMGGVRKTVKPHKLSLSKKTKSKLNRSAKGEPDKKGKSDGKTPSASNVREALASGHITPLEAASLNPKGGLRPNASDVRAAYKDKRISAEEAYDLNPGASLNKDRASKPKQSKPKQSTKKEAPIKVSSERVYPTNEGLQPRTAISPGRQWNNG